MARRKTRAERLASEQKPTRAGVVSVHEIYTLDEFSRRMDLGAWALRHARRNGLRTIQFGRRMLIRGVDFYEYLSRISEPHRGGPVESHSVSSPEDLSRYERAVRELEADGF